jgi:tyrosinase
MVGASKGPGVKLESSVQSVRVALRPPKRARRTPLRALESTGTQELPPRVHLNLENITAGERPIHTYEVYVDIPEGDSPAEHPELMAGLIPRFGLVEASQRDDLHGGQGLNYSFDITDIVSDLESRHAWNPENLTVTFAPHDMEEIAATRTEGRATAKRQPVEVGRVSLYYQ